MVKETGIVRKDDVTDESYGIVCIVERLTERVNYIGDRICMNLATRQGGQTLV